MVNQRPKKHREWKAGGRIKQGVDMNRGDLPSVQDKQPLIRQQSLSFPLLPFILLASFCTDTRYGMQAHHSTAKSLALRRTSWI